MFHFIGLEEFSIDRKASRKVEECAIGQRTEGMGRCALDVVLDIGKGRCVHAPGRKRQFAQRNEMHFISRYSLAQHSISTMLLGY
jgi:hypothetical protein